MFCFKTTRKKKIEDMSGRERGKILFLDLFLDPCHIMSKGPFSVLFH